jgi:hypothetical protein
MTAAPLWARLKADGLVEGELPEREQAASPWFVRVMLGIAFASIMEDAGTAIAVGAACCAGAYWLLRSFDGNDFAEQFGLVASLVGQALIIVGLAQYLKPADPMLYFAIAAVEAALALAVPNFLHRVLAAAGAAIALALGINQLELHGLAAPLLSVGLAFVWLEPRRWAARGRIWRPVGYGLVLALLLIETFRLFGAGWLLGLRQEAPGWFAFYGPLLGRGLTAATLVWVAIVLNLREGRASRISGLALGVAIVVALLSLTAPGLASALLILLLGFAAGSRILAALGILSLLGFVAHFYYSLHATLLEKSGILAATGLCLLAAHFLMRRLLPASGAEEPGHA